MDLQGDAGATQRSRVGDGLITPPFEAVWPDVARCLHALLFRRGLDRVSADDVVQEVALRALAGRVTYTSAKDLLRWAGPVACNLHIDLLRQRARLTDDEVGTDHPATNDVAGEVADRIELQRAFRGIAALRPADREAIMEAVTSEQPVSRNRKEAVRLAVRRHRARSRLALVMEQLAAFVFGWKWLRQPPKAATAAVAMVPVLAAFPLLLVTPVPQEPPTEHVPPRVATPVTQSVPVRGALTVAPPRPKAPPAPPVKVRRSAPRPAPAAVKAPKADPKPSDIDIDGPGEVRITGGGHDRPEGTTYVICLWDVPEVEGDVCV